MTELLESIDQITSDMLIYHTQKIIRGRKLYVHDFILPTNGLRDPKMNLQWVATANV